LRIEDTRQDTTQKKPPKTEEDLKRTEYTKNKNKKKTKKKREMKNSSRQYTA